MYIAYWVRVRARILANCSPVYIVAQDTLEDVVRGSPRLGQVW